jgi:DNA-directed RNA polymerase subunit RPC12/RpoP
MSESLLTPKNVPFDMVHDREHRTDLHCHDCNRTFVALLDYRITGNHVIECPHCGHEHCRVITGGAITGERWDSRYGNDKTRDAIRPRRLWKDGVLQAKTSSAAEFIRSKWLALPLAE